MGTAGAAAVTVTGQPAGGLPGIYLNIKGNKEFPVHFTLHIRKMYVVNIQKAGTPTAIVQGIMSVSFFVSPAGIIFAAIFQVFGNGNFSMYLAFMRQVILLIPISAHTSPDNGCGYGKLMGKHHRSFDSEEEGAVKNGSGYAPVSGFVPGRTTMLCVYSYI